MSGVKTLVGIVILACMIAGCSKVSNIGSPVQVEAYLEDGDFIGDMVVGNMKGKYLKFKLTNTSNEDYLVQFNLRTKGKTQKSENSMPEDYTYEIPKILVPAYAKTENIFGVKSYNRKGYFVDHIMQFYGINYDGSCMAESVEVINLKIVKASERPERIKSYKDEEGRNVYDTQGALPDGGSYSQRILN